MVAFIKRHILASFFTLAFLFSWAIQLPLVFVRQGWITAQIPFSIHYLGALGPALAALLLTGLTSEWQGLRELWDRITRWRVPWPYGVFAVASPLGLFGLAALITRVAQGAWPDLRLLGQVNYLPDLGWWVLPLWLVTFGFGEEIGWRGFALPRLQHRLSVSRATLLLGLLWAAWHLPAFFYHETYLEMGWFMFPGFIIGILCGAVLFTWLYNGSGGSILMAALWHALFDLLTASKAGPDWLPVLTSAGVIAWALVVANIEKPWGFRFQPRQVIDPAGDHP